MMYIMYINFKIIITKTHFKIKMLYSESKMNTIQVPYSVSAIYDLKPISVVLHVRSSVIPDI